MSLAAAPKLPSVIERTIDGQSFCRPFKGYVQPLVEKENNIQIGIGMISKKGLSKGVPIDILNMLIAAADLRDNLEKEGYASTIHLLLADHMAYIGKVDRQLDEAKAVALQYQM